MLVTRFNDAMSRRPRRPWPLALALLAVACGPSEAAGPDGGGAAVPLPTIGGVGVLPDTIARESEPPVIVPPPVNEDGTAAELVGQQIAGNRIILIGDSILAATDRRFGGEMCDALVPLGWVVEVDAEPGRFVEFGTRVLDRRLDPGDGSAWDAAVVFLGSNYRGDQAVYEQELRSILERLAPRPTLLFTVTEYRPAWAEVNEVVRRLADELEHVRLVDWKTIAETPGVLSSDRLHPTEAGELVLADLVATNVGRAPVGDGECLRSQFTDSSAVTGNGSGATDGSAAPAASSGDRTGGATGGLVSPPTTAGGSSGGAASPTTTTATGAGPTTTAGSSPATTGAPATTSPPAGTTAPPTTGAAPPTGTPTTQPPSPPSTTPASTPTSTPAATSPPATAPPATSPPATPPPAPPPPAPTSPPAPPTTAA